MTRQRMTEERQIDTHQHLWMPSERRYDWLEAAGLPLNNDFGPEQVAAEVTAAGITATVLVQAADSYEDTFYMLAVAARTPTIVGVVAWLPLDRPDEAAAALALYAREPLICGIRVLNHSYADPRWLLQTSVQQTIERLAAHELALDVVCTVAEHLEVVAELARRHPQLSIVIDHLGKPEIAAGVWQPWASLIAAAAREPNVSIKLSGLNTASAPGWVVADWQPYVDYVVEQFGSGRIMLGSDWPVSTLNGDFGGVWRAQREAIAGLTADEQHDILHRTAENVYRLDPS